MMKYLIIIYFLHLGNSWKSDTEDDTNKERMPFLASKDSAPGTPVSKETPKYIEVIYEPSPAKENDGYEIPKTVSTKHSDNSRL